MTNRQQQAVLAMANNGMRVTKAAETLGIDGSTMYEHFVRIRRETKLDPQKFYDLAKLVEIVRGEENG